MCVHVWFGARLRGSTPLRPLSGGLILGSSIKLARLRHQTSPVRLVHGRRGVMQISRFFWSCPPFSAPPPRARPPRPPPLRLSLTREAPVAAPRLYGRTVRHCSLVLSWCGRSTCARCTSHQAASTIHRAARAWCEHPHPTLVTLATSLICAVRRGRCIIFQSLPLQYLHVCVGQNKTFQNSNYRVWVKKKSHTVRFKRLCVRNRGFRGSQSVFSNTTAEPVSRFLKIRNWLHSRLYYYLFSPRGFRALREERENL